ncbi:hypothetical protein [Yoonia sp. BS5-3]|uniref:Uncharacterized protein n=1 Tax=Yoonia phaeophyticola TaxID=3137369 RepID=A0ABZ2V6H8_9RHOB
MHQDEFLLSAMAQVGAMRKLVLSALALRLIEESEPLQALNMLGTLVTATPTMPAKTDQAIDPAMSDMLAAMTDDHVSGMIDELRVHLAVAS